MQRTLKKRVCSYELNEWGKVRCSRPEVFCKIVFLKIPQNSQESTSGLQLY